MKTIVVFGTGRMALMLVEYMKRDGYNISALTVDKEYINTDVINELIVKPFEDIEVTFPPEEYDMIVALGYANMNASRLIKCNQAKAKGYNLINYISPFSSTITINYGVNNIIMDNVTIEPFVSLGDGNIFWPGCCISHHTTIKDYCHFSSGSITAGGVVVENLSFFGIGSTINEDVTIAESTLVGAGVNISKNTEVGAVYVPQRYIKIDKESNNFFRY